MTVIEFFDKSPIENIVSSFTVCPDKIIFIGDAKAVKRSLPLYEKFLNAKGLQIKMDKRSVNKSNLWDIVQKLSAIVEAEEECIFDLTGGEDLILVALGIVFQNYRDKKKIHMHRFNISNGTILDCDCDGEVHYCGTPRLTVKENIMLHGGIVERFSAENAETCRACSKDIDAAWKISCENPSLWNVRIGLLKEFQKYKADVENPLRVYIDISYASSCIRNFRDKLGYVGTLLQSARAVGLIRDYLVDEESLSFTYVNALVKEMFSNEGAVLELKISHLAREMTNKGTTVFGDVLRGVVIDWDGMIHEQDDSEKDTVNEIDVLAMKGMVPVFISCKNGSFKDEELYKLHTVASRFGGTHARKLLVCSDGKDRLENFSYLDQRATDMGIKIVPVIKDGECLSDAEIVNALIQAI